MKLLIILLLVSFNTYGQEAKDDILHYGGSFGLTALTYSVPRNTLDLSFLESAGVCFILNEIVGQLVEKQQGNNYSKKDLRINRYGTITGILSFELGKQNNKAKALENQIEEVNTHLVNLGKQNKYKYYSIELSAHVKNNGFY